MRKATKGKLKELGYSSYAAYTQSPHWHSVKNRYMASPSTRKTCFICGARVRLHLHHVSYDRIGSEKLVDLILLCAKHHRGVHLHIKHTREPLATAHLGYASWIAAGRPKRISKARRRRRRRV